MKLTTTTQVSVDGVMQGNGGLLDVDRSGATGQGRKTDAADAHPGGAGRHPDDRPAPGGR
jgi:hypothetical protein